MNVQFLALSIKKIIKQLNENQHVQMNNYTQPGGVKH